MEERASAAEERDGGAHPASSRPLANTEIPEKPYGPACTIVFAFAPWFFATARACGLQRPQRSVGSRAARQLTTCRADTAVPPPRDRNSPITLVIFRLQTFQREIVRKARKQWGLPKGRQFLPQNVFASQHEIDYLKNCTRNLFKGKFLAPPPPKKNV